MSRFLCVLAMVVVLIMGAVGALVGCGSEDVFTEENLRSYRVFEAFAVEYFDSVTTDKEDRSAQSAGVRYADGSTTVRGEGDDLLTRAKTQFNASISNRNMSVHQSYVGDRCGAMAGPVPKYDDLVGESSRSWIDCNEGSISYRERMQISTRFMRNGVLYTVWIVFYNQGLPTDLSALDGIVKVAQDWDADIATR